MPAVSPPPVIAWIAPDARLLFLANLVTVVAVVLFAGGVVYVLLRRTYHRRLEEQKLAAMGTATARILHQIKNPLQTLMLHAELLQEAERSGDRRANGELCEAIVGESQRLAAMLGELSLYASGARRMLHLEPCPLHDLLAQVARTEAREQKLAVDARDLAEVVVRADPYYLRQALENLVSNAREAMREQPDARLTLRLHRAGGVAEVGIADNGPGIPPERLETLFQPFVSGKSRGMGLGLAIAREIVEGHGGRIEVDSEVGVGTTFRVLLPIHSPGAVDARAPVQGGVS